jgi:emfourin
VEVTIERCGGFVGRAERLGPVDTANLAHDLARRVGAVVSKIKFFDLPATITRPGGADVVEYKTTVIDGGRIHTVYSNDLSDAAYQNELADLIGLLEVSGAKFAVIEAWITAKIAMEASRYDLTGGGLTLSYFTFADLNKERILWYSNGHRSVDFYEKDVRIGDVPDLDGHCVTVTLEGEGATAVTATLLVPRVGFTGADTAWSSPIEAVMIVASPAASGRGKSYDVIRLVGEACNHD